MFGVGPGASRPTRTCRARLRAEPAEDGQRLAIRELTRTIRITMETDWFTSASAAEPASLYYPHFEVAVASAVSPSGATWPGATDQPAVDGRGHADRLRGPANMWGIRRGQRQVRQDGRPERTGASSASSTCRHRGARAQGRPLRAAALMRFFAAGIPFPVNKNSDYSKPDEIMTSSTTAGSRSSEARPDGRDDPAGSASRPWVRLFPGPAHDLANREATTTPTSCSCARSRRISGSNVRGAAISSGSRIRAAGYQRRLAGLDQARQRYESERAAERRRTAAGTSKRAPDQIPSDRKVAAWT